MASMGGGWRSLCLGDLIRYSYNRDTRSGPLFLIVNGANRLKMAIEMMCEGAEEVKKR